MTEAEMVKSTGLPRRTVRRLRAGAVKAPKAKTKAGITRGFRSIAKVERREYEELVDVWMDSDVALNADKWNNLYRHIPYMGGTGYYQVQFEVLDGSGTIISSNQFTNSTTFITRMIAYDKWLEMFMSVWGHVINKIGIHVSQGEGSVHITHVRYVTW
jgi:hypothetical protein